MFPLYLLTVCVQVVESIVLPKLLPKLFTWIEKLSEMNKKVGTHIRCRDDVTNDRFVYLNRD